jgi:hypothetical protein
MVVKEGAVISRNTAREVGVNRNIGSVYLVEENHFPRGWNLDRCES